MCAAAATVRCRCWLPPRALADVPVYLEGVGTIEGAQNGDRARRRSTASSSTCCTRKGQDVRRGDVLARIDPTTYKALLDQAAAKKAQDEATLANARIDLERYARLAATNSINQQQLDTQRALVTQLEALVKLDQGAIDNAQAYLSWTTITAPIDGRIGIRLIDEGNIVHASDPTGIVVITQIQPISVLFNLPQQQLGQINKAFAKGPLSVEVLGPDNKTIIDRGTLQVIDNQVDPLTGTIRLKAEFPNPELQLMARAIRQCPAADRYLAAGCGGAHGRRAARPERTIRLCGAARRHRRGPPSDHHAAGRSPGGDRERRCDSRARDHHGLLSPDRRRAHHGRKRRGSPHARREARGRKADGAVRAARDPRADAAKAAAASARTPIRQARRNERLHARSSTARSPPRCLASR